MTAYTYLITHIPSGKRYYGVRYKSGCDPSDLWVTYFTSSKIVKQLIERDGKESFSVSIRKTFFDSRQALKWEATFLTKIDAATNPAWLNQSNGNSKFRSPTKHTEKTKQILRNKITGKKRCLETKQKLSQTAIVREENKRKNNWKMPKTSINKAIQTRQNRMELGEINPYSEERNKKMGNSKRGTKRKYLSDGSFIMVKPET